MGFFERHLSIWGCLPRGIGTNCRSLSGSPGYDIASKVCE